MKPLFALIIAILLAQFLFTEGSSFNLPKTIDGKPVNKKLHAFITQLANVSQEIYYALKWNVKNELSVVQELADEGDLKWYEIAIKEIAAGAQRILNSTLKEVKYKGKVNINSFIRAIEEFKSTKTIRDLKMAELAQTIFNHRKGEFEASGKQSQDINHSF